jgi:hypothetical protein
LRQAAVSSTGEICFRRSRSEASVMVNSVILKSSRKNQKKQKNQEIVLRFFGFSYGFMYNPRHLPSLK